MKSHEIIEENRKKRIEELTKDSKPAEAIGLINELINMKDMSSQQRMIIQQRLESAFTKTGERFLERAFLEELMNEKEWIKMRDKMGFELSDMATILLPIFGKMDKHIKENKNCIIATMDGSSIHKNKDFVLKRFNIIVKTTEEIIEEMSKIPKNLDNVDGSFIIKGGIKMKIEESARNIWDSNLKDKKKESRLKIIDALIAIEKEIDERLKPKAKSKAATKGGK